MKPFLRLTAQFLLPVFLLAIAAESYVRSLPNSYRAKRQALERHAARTEVLVLGNSHAFFGLRPDVMEVPAINLANVSQTLDYDLLLFRICQPLMPRLRRVYLTVDHSNLFDLPLEEGPEAFRTTYYDRYLGVRPPGRFLPCPPELAYFGSFKAKLLRGLSGHLTPDCDNLGWGNGYTLSQRPPAACTEDEALRVAHKHACADRKRFEGNIRQLCALAQACNACHVELVFVATPVTAAYLRHIPQGQKRLLAQTYDCFRRRYAVRIADYSADTRFADSDFYDADHLSDRGAARLTHLLTATEADSTYK